MKYSLGVLLAIVVAAGFTLVSGTIQGHMSKRWGLSIDADPAVARLAELPEQFGNWKVQSTGEMSEHVIDMLQCAGYSYRTYENTVTGETVNVTVLLGPSGPISVHTPEVCYSSRAYETRDERRPVEVEGAEGAKNKFWRLTFRSSRLEADVLRVYYAWSSGGRWSASKQPRVEFAGVPYLYKLQLAGTMPPGTDTEEAEDPCLKFLQAFVPVAADYLVEPPKE